jgi:hypothetical protein
MPSRTKKLQLPPPRLIEATLLIAALPLPLLLTFPQVELGHTTERATAMTIVLVALLAQHGHVHGGINE